MGRWVLKGSFPGPGSYFERSPELSVSSEEGAHLLQAREQSLQLRFARGSGLFSGVCVRFCVGCLKFVDSTGFRVV